MFHVKQVAAIGIHIWASSDVSRETPWGQRGNSRLIKGVFSLAERNFRVEHDELSLLYLRGRMLSESILFLFTSGSVVLPAEGY